MEFDLYDISHQFDHENPTVSTNGGHAETTEDNGLFVRRSEEQPTYVEDAANPIFLRSEFTSTTFGFARPVALHPMDEMQISESSRLVELDDSVEQLDWSRMDYDFDSGRGKNDDTIMAPGGKVLPAAIHLPESFVETMEEIQSAVYTSNNFQSILPGEAREASSSEFTTGTITLPKRRRTRRDKGKKKVTPNNRYGRKGNLRCATCRARRQSCVYISEFEPCDFCRERGIKEPCVKITAREADAAPLDHKEVPASSGAVHRSSTITLSTYRPSVTPYDATIDPKDRHHLQRIYAEECYPNPPDRKLILLFRKFAFIYGPSICNVGLRHAMFACSGDIMNIKTVIELNLTTEDCSTHLNQAVHMLRLKLDDYKMIDEADLFTAGLLAWCSLSERETRTSAKVHVEGFLSLLKHLVAQKPVDFYSLRQFWAMMRDILVFAAEFPRGPEADAISSRLLEGCPQILKSRSIQACLDYYSLLRRDEGGQRYPAEGVHAACRQHFLQLKGIFVSLSDDWNPGPANRTVLNLINDIERDLAKVNEEELFESFASVCGAQFETMTGLPEDWGELENLSYQGLDFGRALVFRQLCFVLLAALKNDGVNSYLREGSSDLIAELCTGLLNIICRIDETISQWFEVVSGDQELDEGVVDNCIEWDDCDVREKRRKVSCMDTLLTATHSITGCWEEHIHVLRQVVRFQNVAVPPSPGRLMVHFLLVFGPGES